MHVLYKAAFEFLVYLCTATFFQQISTKFDIWHPYTQVMVISVESRFLISVISSDLLGVLANMGFTNGQGLVVNMVHTGPEKS